MNAQANTFAKLVPLFTRKTAILKIRAVDNNPEYLAQRNALPKDLMPIIVVVEALAVKAGE
jgi:hypothetical protein